jgi:asparagine synthase (glutamine-hydrolysing)
MCGIAGIFHSSGRNTLNDSAILHLMTDAIAYRGPDGEGHLIEHGVSLGHRRLSIIDVQGGAQPMCNEDKTVAVVFNGEIYNFEGLKLELESMGHKFANHSDTEVLVHGWEQWGVDLLSRIKGMYAFAIWDSSQRTLFIARDRLGKKPLYYAKFNGTLVFASEMASIRTVPEIDESIDIRAFDDYMALGYIPEPETIFNGIKRLEAAHYILLRQGDVSAPIKPVRYWEPNWTTFNKLDSLNEAATMLDDLLNQAVRERLMSDVPLGAFLSGGIDSGLVVASASSISNEPLSTFTVAFPGEGDESSMAAQVAALFKTDHHVSSVTPDYLAAARWQAAIFGEPFGDTSSVPTLEVCRLARKHVTVALSGDGGDEAFGGYRRHRYHLLAESVRSLIPTGMRKAILAPLAAIYPKLDFAPKWLRAKTTLTEMSLESAVGYYRTVCKMHEERRRELMSPMVRAKLLGYDPGARFALEMARTDDPLRQAQLADLSIYLPGDILTKVDRTSMAASLEARAPLLDPAIVEFGLSLPAKLKIAKGKGKMTMRILAARKLPANIANGVKRGFATPLADAFRERMDEVKTRLFSSSMMDSGLFDRDALIDLTERHAKGADESAALWQLLVMEGFLAKIPRPIEAPVPSPSMVSRRFNHV